MRLTLKSVDRAKRISLPSVVVLIQLAEALERTKVLNKREDPLPNRPQTETSAFSCFYTQTETLALSVSPGSHAFWYLDWNCPLSSPGSSGAQGLQLANCLFVLVSLHSHMS